MNPNAHPTVTVPTAEGGAPQRRRPAALLAARAVLGCLLAALLACGLVPFAPRAAGADEVDEAAVAEAERAVEEAQGALDGAESNRQGIAADHEALVKEVADLQKRIDETTAQALEAQQEVIDGRAALAKAAVYEYRGGSAQSLVKLLLEAESFDELVRNLVYLSSVVQYQVDEVEAQKERSARFDALMEDLNAQKDEQDRKLAELEEKKVQAEQTVSDASTKLQGAQGEYASMVEELQRKIEEAEAQGSAPAEPVAVDESNTNTVRPGDQMTDVAPDPSPSPAPAGPRESPRHTAAPPTPTRPIPAPRPRAPCATTGPWAWPCPWRGHGTGSTTGAPSRSPTAA